MVRKKQTTKTLSTKKQWFIIAGLMVLLFGFAFSVYGIDWRWHREKTWADNVGKEVTLEGKLVCLPHKDTSGPQTMECATGLKVNSGKYYGLRGDSIAGKAVGTNEVIKVTGILEKPGDSKYDIIASLHVTE